jgi:hypothetical protein
LPPSNTRDSSCRQSAYPCDGRFELRGDPYGPALVGLGVADEELDALGSSRRYRIGGHHCCFSRRGGSRPGCLSLAILQMVRPTQPPFGHHSTPFVPGVNRLFPEKHSVRYGWEAQPAGRKRVAQRFIAGNRGTRRKSPVRDERMRPRLGVGLLWGSFRPWRGLAWPRLWRPSVETLGYCRSSLRDYLQESRGLSITKERCGAVLPQRSGNPPARAVVVGGADGSREIYHGTDDGPMVSACDVTLRIRQVPPPRPRSIPSSGVPSP